MEILYNATLNSVRDKLKRPLKDQSTIRPAVQAIMQDVRVNGDEALRRYEERFDHVRLGDLRVGGDEFEAAEHHIPQDLKVAIDQAIENVRAFHLHQKQELFPKETMPGVFCWQKYSAIERVGLYVPGGSASLVSTAIMLGVPCQIVGTIFSTLCTPPRPDGSVDPAILYVAHKLDLYDVVKVGGAQAIAALTYGTKTVLKADKIFGPGNQYVTCAKQMAAMEGVDIDMPAGPSEVMVVADSGASPDYVAIDLLAQAEHGPDSQVIFLTTERFFIPQVEEALERHLATLPRREIAEKALQNALIINCIGYDKMMDIVNYYAPEHLIINTRNYRELAEKVTDAGSVFLGPYAPESAGDYASGTNHVLPTNGWARAYSGVNLESFYRRITFQHISRQGALNLAPTVERLAQHEGLEAHRRAMELRRLDIEASQKRDYGFDEK